MRCQVMGLLKNSREPTSTGDPIETVIKQAVASYASCNFFHTIVEYICVNIFIILQMNFSNKILCHKFCGYK